MDLREVKCQGLVCEWPYVSWPKKLSQPGGGKRKARPSFPGCMLLRWALSVIKNLPAKAGDTRDAGLISGLGKSPGGGHGTHSSILAWELPWAEEPGGPQSMRSQRIRHN